MQVPDNRNKEVGKPETSILPFHTHCKYVCQWHTHPSWGQEWMPPPPAMDIYDPSTIHALITTAGDQDQQEDRCQHCLLSECVTVCVWTEGWCRVGHIVTMALFLVTTQRNNSSFPPHHHHQSTSGCVSTAPTPKQIIPQSTFFKWNVLILLALCRVDSEVCASDNKQLQWNWCRMSKYHFSTTLEINGPIL